MISAKNSFLGVLVGALLYAAPVAAQTRYVCAAGDVTCGGTPAHATLQAAITAAVSGDTILVKASETFNECITVPNKGNLATPITIRSDADDANLPATGYRANPDLHAAYMPDIRGTSSCPNAGFQFAVGAQDYVLRFLEFKSNHLGQGDLIAIGFLDSTQQFAADQPGDIVIDRSIIRGSDVFGQKRCITVNGRDITITNNHIDRCSAVGFDSQAIAGFNGWGPITVVNNRLEGAAENFMLGGADPHIYTTATVATSPAPTTTTARLENFRAGHTIGTLSVGQFIAVLTTNNTVRRHTYVRAISGNDITFDALPEAPTAGAGSDVRWGAIYNNITFRRNYVRKPVEWMDPIQAIPTGVSVTATVGGGGNNLAAGNHCYRVVARNSGGYAGQSHYSTATTEVCASLSATGKTTIAWTAAANATHYRVFGRLSGAPTGYIETTGTSVDDTGAALTASGIPTPTRWSVKNLFEIKFGTSWQIDSNIFEQSWLGVDVGSAMWIKSENQDGGCEFCIGKDVVIEKNIIRSVPGFISVSAIGSQSGVNGTSPVENLTIRNNLGYDSNSTWGAVDGIWAIKLLNGPKNVRIEHNTFLHHAHGFMGLFNVPVNGLIVKDNIARAETYGIFGGCQGTCALSSNTVGGVYTWAGNVLCGAASSLYPSTGGNLYPTTLDCETNHFTAYGNGVNGTYSLVAGSAWNDTASDGTDRGADIAAVLAATAGVVEGTPEGTAFTPITITTATPTQGTVGLAYSWCPSATPTTGPYTWTVSSGSLPAWASIASATGCITGTPTAVASTAFTIRVQDSQGTPQSDTQDVTVTIVAAPVAVTITTTSPLSGGTVAADYSLTLAATGGTGPYTWAVASGSLPTGLALSTAGTLSGIPLFSGTTTFTVRATDFTGVATTKVVAITIARETLPCNRPVRLGQTEVIIFRRTTAPTMSMCVMTGDLWVDLSSTALTTYKARVSSGVLTWTADAAAEAVTELPTPSAGDILVGTAEGEWQRLAAGAVGTYLRSCGTVLCFGTDGGLLTGLNAAALSSGTVPTARLTAGLGAQTITFQCCASITTTNLPVGGAPLGGDTGIAGPGKSSFTERADLRGVSQCAATVYALAGGTATTDLIIQYYDGAAWQSTGITVAVGATSGYKMGSYQTLAAGARTSDLTSLIPFLDDGDGAVDPITYRVSMTCKP